MIMFSVAEQIKKILADKDMTAYRLSWKTGISESHLSKILSGKQKPNLDTLFAIIVGLDMGIREKGRNKTTRQIYSFG